METGFALIVLSTEYKRDEESAILLQLFEHGLNYFHLRKPGWTEEEMESFIQSIPEAYHNRIVIHSHFHLIERFRLRGIHLSGKNRKELAPLNQEHVVSSSFHSFGEIKENHSPYQYVFLSPVFDSISKPGYKSKVNLTQLSEELKLWKEGKRIPKIIGLGGVNEENISQVAEAGFSGAGLLGAIWESENPVKTYLAIEATAKMLSRL
jgi:thiamine-phosphate pyrophosphorylase